MACFIRISALLWADILAGFAMYMIMTYLTDIWNLSTTHAAGIVNFRNGITSSLVIIFAFFVDAFMGDFYMLVISSIAYSVGLGLLSVSTPPVFGPCSDYKEECIGYSQQVLFYMALPLIAVGKAGHVVSFEPFLDLQSKKTENEKDKEKEKQKKKKKKKNRKRARALKKNGINLLLKLIPVLMMMVVVLIVEAIVYHYKKAWSLRFGIPAICSVMATVLFLTGFRVYKCVQPEGSPLTITFRVFVASARKISQPIPNPNDLYNDEDARSTSTLRWLDKAAIKLPDQKESKSWNLCSVSEVEDTKTGIRMLPMWLTFIVIGIVLSIGNTYFLEQANHMDRKLGRIKVPIPIFLFFYNSSKSIFASLYSILRNYLPEKYTPALGIATSMVISVLCCITAAKVETRRLHRIKDHGLLDKPDDKIPMSIFALVPQFMLLASVDGIANNSIKSFFNQQAPDSMHKYLDHFTKGVLGLGKMASVLSVFVVGKVSEYNHKLNWFQFSLNRSRLDRYYWVLAALSAANLVVYVIIASFYKYKEPQEDDIDETEGEEMSEGFHDN